ncbi:MAG: HU family DNA-binding protein [Sulfurovaceae bacterium]
MNKKDFTEIVKEMGSYDTAVEAKRALNAVQDALFKIFTDKGGVRLNHLGTFSTKERKEREYTIGGKTTKVPAHIIPKFTPSSTLKRAIND